jgi:hypothetical protein
MIGVLLSFRYKKVYNKRTKRWTVLAQKVPKTYAYIPALQASIIGACMADNKPIARKRGLEEDDPRNIAPTIAAEPAPPTEVLVLQHKSRFGQKKLKTEKD